MATSISQNNSSVHGTHGATVSSTSRHEEPAVVTTSDKVCSFFKTYWPIIALGIGAVTAPTGFIAGIVLLGAIGAGIGLIGLGVCIYRIIEQEILFYKLICSTDKE